MSNSRAATCSQDRDARKSTPHVLVVGAGMAGLACAGRLRQSGLEVTVVDKGRGPGGRATTRREAENRFDHGAQYLTVSDPRFHQAVETWLQEGVVVPWRGRVCTLQGGELSDASGATQRYVGVPGMSSILRRMAAGLTVNLEQRVVALLQEEATWVARCDGGMQWDGFSLAVIAVPAPQAVPLLAAAPELAARAAAVEMEPCFAVMVAFNDTVDSACDGAFVVDSPLSWIARNSSKPGRSGGECWVLHANPEWSRAHVDADPEAVIQSILRAFSSALQRRLPEVAFARAHRWLHARVCRALDREYLYAPGVGLAACGDWCLGERIEHAYLSGLGLGERIVAALR